MALEYLDDSSLVIQAELPGVDPERDIEVWIAYDVLHIRASRDLGPEPGDHASDLRYGAFVRDIALPPGTEEEFVSATYADGLLEVRAPIGDPARPAATRIPVVVRRPAARP